MKKHQNHTDPQNLIHLQEVQNMQNSDSDQNIDQQEEEFINSDTEYTQSDETLDMAILQELIRDEEKSLDLLIKDNDRAAEYILGGDIPNALSILEKMEKLMEYIATNGKVLDRNIIIVCLYNIASAHQANWALEKCAKYIEAVTYNLAQSIKHDELNHVPTRGKASEDPHYSSMKAITLRKKQFLVKVYLQYCAVTSQLNKHDDSLTVAQKAQRVMTSIVSESLMYCRETHKEGESENKHIHITPQKTSDRSRLTTVSGVSVDLRKSLLNDITFRDEVYYNRHIIDSASPFLEDFVKNTQDFSRVKMHEIINHTRNLLFNWKNNPENNEKYIRKELTKDKVPSKITEENRTLLGVQQDPEWLATLNIGSIMHMRPLKYKDYAQKREFINELTKTSLQEKVIFQSLTYFTLATEMRFIEMNKDTIGDHQLNGNHSTKDNQTPKNTSYRASEAYHLKAIEVACRYITGPCPYINHLISSYQKHYGQDLETIPEESINSFSSSLTGRELNVADKVRYMSGRMVSEEATPFIKLQAQENKLTGKRQPPSRERERVKVIRENTAELEAVLEDDVSRYKRDRKQKDNYKSLNIRTKKLSNKIGDLKKVYTNNLSVSSPTRNSHSNSEISALSPKHFKTYHIDFTPFSHISRVSRYDTENVPSHHHHHHQHHYEGRYSKRDLNVPSLGLHNVVKDTPTSQHTSNKVSINEGLGYRSERVAENTGFDFLTQYNSSEPERHKGMGAGSNEMNVYLYKNFNKFIQNFYVKNEQANKNKALENKIKEKFSNNPYQKELLASKTKKVLVTKKPTPTPSTSSTLPRQTYSKTPTFQKHANLSPNERYAYDEDIKKIESRRPKTGSKRPTEEIPADFIRKTNPVNLRISDKHVKPFNIKDLDSLKGSFSVKKG